MKTTKEHLLEKYRQGLDFVSGTHFGEPMYWVAKLPMVDDHKDMDQSMELETRCASLLNPVYIFYNLLPQGLFYFLAVTVAFLGLQCSFPDNLVLFAMALGLFSLPQVLTVGDYKKFRSSLNVAKRFIVQNVSLRYVDESLKDKERERIHTDIMNSIEDRRNILPKVRENYGAVPLALLDNLIRRRADYDKSTTIDYSDSRENLAKISNIANKIGCKPENIRTELDNFKTIGSLLSQPTSRLKNCLKYMERIKQSPEYSSNEDFKKQTDYLYRQTRLKISKNRNSL